MTGNCMKMGYPVYYLEDKGFRLEIALTLFLSPSPWAISLISHLFPREQLSKIVRYFTLQHICNRIKGFVTF